MRVYGVCNHSPDYIVSWLIKVLKYSSRNIHILPVGNNVPKKPAKDLEVFLFLNKKSFKLNLDRLNSKPYTSKVGIVFSDPLTLYGFQNVLPLDFVESTDIHIDAFLLQPPDVDKFKVESLSTNKVDANKSDYLNKVLTRVCSFNSLLNPLMSFIYTLPNSSHQKPVKEIICKWLYSGKEPTELERILDTKEHSLPLSEKQRQRIQDILYTEDGNTYRKALTEVKKYTQEDKIPYKEIVSTFNVSAYDLRYIQAIVKASSEK